ncbi:MAG: histidinol-phosphatase [Trueperaceae bacterium]
MIDLHTHHHRCGHARGDLVDYVEAASSRGLRTIGLSDHAPLFDAPGDDPAPGLHMPASAWDGYLAEAAEVREAYADRIAVRVGVEADHLAIGSEAYARALNDPRLDHVLGAVHYVDGVHVYDRSKYDGDLTPDEAHAAYYAEVARMATSGLFDVLAHVDAVKVVGPAPRTPPVGEIEAMVDAIAAAGVAIEVNTSGVAKCGEPFPGPDLLQRLAAAGVPLALGSDAHDPERVGGGFDEVLGALARLGVREIVDVRGRSAAAVATADGAP